MVNKINSSVYVTKNVSALAAIGSQAFTLSYFSVIFFPLNGLHFEHFTNIMPFHMRSYFWFSH